MYRTPRDHAMANLGCGLRCLPNWLNVDGVQVPCCGPKVSFVNRILYKLPARLNFILLRNTMRFSKNKLFYDLRMGVPFNIALLMLFLFVYLLNT
jgi:hypothetical protein